ncbi:MAG: flagellar hook-associated protein FlgL [Bdellovibrio sp.]
MSRVSENSSSAAVNHAVNRIKTKMEDLQVKGSTLKQISRPSDNPISSVEALAITSQLTDNNQYMRNADYASMYLNITEKSLEEISDLLVKAKEIAIAQSSDFYDANVRKNISNEIVQIRNQVMAIANKRVGQKYIFSGFKTLTKPFSDDGKYNGDHGSIQLEVAKDFFVPINLTGHTVFISDDENSLESDKLIKPDPNQKQKLTNISRDLASEGDAPFAISSNLFSQLDTFITALENNDAEMIQDLLEKFDDSISRLITLRTRVGSIISSVASAKSTMESNNVNKQERRSNLVDADIAELFSDITKQQSVLKTTYQASKSSLNQTLLDFIK